MSDFDFIAMILTILVSATLVFAKLQRQIQSVKWINVSQQQQLDTLHHNRKEDAQTLLRTQEFAIDLDDALATLTQRVGHGSEGVEDTETITERISSIEGTSGVTGDVDALRYRIEALEHLNLKEVNDALTTCVADLTHGAIDVTYRIKALEEDIPVIDKKIVGDSRRIASIQERLEDLGTMQDNEASAIYRLNELARDRDLRLEELENTVEDHAKEQSTFYRLLGRQAQRLNNMQGLTL